jgi:hypothetical protein
MMKPMRGAGKAVSRWLQRAIVALAQPPAHPYRHDWTQYYRYPMF